MCYSLGAALSGGLLVASVKLTGSFDLDALFMQSLGFGSSGWLHISLRLGLPPQMKTQFSRELFRRVESSG